MANIYLSAKKDLTAATATTLYTVPSNTRAIVKSLLVSSDNASDTTITVDLFNGDPASADKFTLFNVTSIAGNASTQLLTEPLIMLENEVLQVTAADAGRLCTTARLFWAGREDA